MDYSATIIPKHWELSKVHQFDISDIIKEEYEELRQFYSKQTLSSVLQTIQERTNPLVQLAMSTSYFTNISYEDTIKNSVFDQRTSFLLFEQYFLLTLTEYINLANNPSMLFQDEQEIQNMEDIFVVQNLDEFSTDTNIDLQPQETEILLQGNQIELKQNVANLLLCYLRSMKSKKDTILMSYDKVMDYVFKLKEREKDIFTDRKKNMTDDELIVDQLFQKNKLGTWSKGMQKGITQYTKEGYDEEREVMQQITDAETQLSQNPDVTDSNRDIYITELMEQDNNDEKNDADAYDMSFMTEDYDDGNYGGDEIDNDEF